MNPLEYLRLQLRLEGKEIVNSNLLRQVEVVPGEEMPFMIMAQMADQQAIAFYNEEALSSELREKLNRRMHSFQFPNIHSIVDALQSLRYPVEVAHYKTYIFPTHYKSFTLDEVKQFSKQDPKVHAFGFDGFAEQVYAVERDGKIVSACMSVRENRNCGEAWVLSDVSYRRQGLAQRVVGAWAESLLAANKIPLYSHKIENIASANLAKRLKLKPVYEQIVIST